MKSNISNDAKHLDFHFFFSILKKTYFLIDPERSKISSQGLVRLGVPFREL